MTDRPILYSFRRCPYAMRARLALDASGIGVELREIVLRDKAPEFLATSPSATVPCLKTQTHVIDESLDIMVWALDQSDPLQWLEPETGSKDEMLTVIAACDGPFKRHLDRYKYDTRYDDADKESERTAASQFLKQLDERLTQSQWLFGARPCMADYAILPFVRQFANAGRDWFDAQDWEALKAWLVGFEQSDRFAGVMSKYDKWQAGDVPVLFKGAVG